MTVHGIQSSPSMQHFSTTKLGLKVQLATIVAWGILVTTLTQFPPVLVATMWQVSLRTGSTKQVSSSHLNIMSKFWDLVWYWYLTMGPLCWNSMRISPQANSLAIASGTPRSIIFSLAPLCEMDLNLPNMGSSLDISKEQVVPVFKFLPH